MKITSTQIDHLGLVAGVFDRLGIGDVIDSRLGNPDIIKSLIQAQPKL